MKLVVSLLLCFFVGALADHKHKPFGDDVVPAIEANLKRLKNFNNLYTDIESLRKGTVIREVTVDEIERENGDESLIAFRAYNMSLGSIKPKWEITRNNENQLKIKIELTQTDMWLTGDVVFIENKLAGPGEITGTRDKKHAVIKWKENSGKVSMTVNLIDGNLNIDDLKSEVNVPKPEVDIQMPKKDTQLEDSAAREINDLVLHWFEELVKERMLRGILHDVLRDVESKREQSQQQSTKK